MQRIQCKTNCFDCLGSYCMDPYLDMLSSS